MLALKHLHIGEAEVSDRAWKLGSKDKNESLCWYTWPFDFSVSPSQFPSSWSKGHQMAPVGSSPEETFWNLVLREFLVVKIRGVLEAQRSSHRDNFGFLRGEFLSFRGSWVLPAVLFHPRPSSRNSGLLTVLESVQSLSPGCGQVAPLLWRILADEVLGPAGGCGRINLMNYWMCYDLWRTP